MSDNKTVYRGKDYPVHSPGPWSVTAGVVPDRKGRLIVEDCNGNPVCATSARGVQGRVPIMEPVHLYRIVEHGRADAAVRRAMPTDCPG